MSTFRETAVAVTCGECGNRVRLPPARPGLLLKCPKCGSLLRAPSPSKAIQPTAASRVAPLQPPPKAKLAPLDDVAAEIDALLLSDIPVKEPHSSVVERSSQAEKPSHRIPSTEVPPPEPPHNPATHPGVVAFDAPADPHESNRDEPSGEYKLSDALGPLPLPPPLPPTAFAPPPRAADTARGEREFHLSAQLDLPEAAGSRMQHVIDIESAEADFDVSHSAGDKPPAKRPEKFTPDATLADPRRAFLRGVFEFPFYLEVMPQWIKLAFTLTLELILAWWIVAVMKSSNGAGFWNGGGIAMGSLLMLAPAILFGFIWVAMTWAVGSAVLEDTAAGMKHIENWPESLVLDDLPSLVFPAGALFLSALPGVGINWLSEHWAPWVWPLAPITTVLLFPFVLLSILETNSIFVPFSKPIFRCVRNRPGTWIWFYLESCAIVGAAAFGSAELWLRSGGSVARIAFAAVLATAAILLYFRLLGRLALVCTNQAYDWTVEETEEEAAESGEEAVSGRQGVLGSDKAS